MKKVIVAGGRDFSDREQLENALWGLFSDDYYWEPIEIVSGMARGADLEAVAFAERRHLPLAKFPADWDRHGKRAGYLRNEQMAEYADTLVAFWDGESRGTKHMIDIALRKGLEVHVYRY